MSTRAFIWVVLGLALGACNRTNLPSYVQLGPLRILALKALANQSEVSPGTTVTVQPVISDLNGGGRTLNVEVKTCLDPGVAFGAKPVCRNPDSTTSSSFSGSTLSTNGTNTGEAPTFTVSVPASPTGFDFLPSAQRYNGMVYLVVYNLTADDGSHVNAFKRLVISDPSKTTKNQNPSISQILGAGVALSALNSFTSSGIDLALNVGIGGETYSVMHADGSLETLNETLTTTWFLTDGQVDASRTIDLDGNHWEPPGSKPDGRAASLVVVTHDGRGGEDYKILEFN